MRHDVAAEPCRQFPRRTRPVSLNCDVDVDHALPQQEIAHGSADEVERRQAVHDGQEALRARQSANPLAELFVGLPHG